MAIVGVLTTILAGNNAPLMASLAQSETALRGYGAGAAPASAIAQKALLGIGLGAAAGVVLAVKAAADFEDAMTGVRKTVDETDLTAAGMTFEGLGMQFRQMATEIPVAATELAAIGETAGALGIRATDIEAFTRTVALLGSTTDLSTTQAAESLGKVGTILGLTGGEYLAFADVLVNLGNKGASTESEIIQVAQRFAAAGMQAGLSVPEILAFSSAIASAGVEPEAAGSSLSRLFGNMVLGVAKATDAGKAFAKTTGMAFGEFSELVKTDTVGAMMLVLSSLKDLDQFGQARALSAMGITNVRDVNAIRLLAGTYETNLVPALDNARNSQGALMTEADKRFQSFNVQLMLLGNNFTELAIKLGTPLLPALTTFVQDLSAAVGTLEGTFQRVVAMYNNLPPGVRDFLEKPIDITPIAPNLVEPQAPGLGVKPGLTDTLGQALGIIPQGVFSGQEKPWGTFNTPGFRAGEVGSPFAGPLSPGWRPGQAGSPLYGPPTPIGGFGGGMMRDRSQPIQITINSRTTLDGQVIADNVERRFYNDASNYSSGFSAGPSPIR